MRNFRLLLTLAAMAALTGCMSIKDKVAFNEKSPAIDTLRIELLKCSCDDTTQLAVRNAMVAEFFRRADVRIVEDGPADVVLDGTIGFAEGSVTQGKFSAFSAGSGSTSGKYPTGITLMAKRGGTLIATGGYTQPVKAGGQPSPEGMAGKATASILRPLFASGMRPKTSP